MIKVYNRHYVATVVEEEQVIQITLEAVTVQIIEVEMDVTDYSKTLIIPTKVGMVHVLEAQEPWFLIRQNLSQF